MLRTLALLAALALAAGGAFAQSPSTHRHSFGDAERWAHVFDDPKRDAWQKPHEVIQALALKPDAVIADIGSGTGYFAVRLASMVPRGRVYGVDVEPDMVKYLGERAKREKRGNVLALAGAPDDPRLPEKADLILMVDVFHHIDQRERYFRKLKGYLKPGGRIAIVDFRLDSPEGPPKAARIAPERVIAELKGAGYALAKEHGFLPNQYFLVFEPAREATALEPVQVSKSVYFVRGETGLPSAANRGFTSNAGFVITSEGVVVFDALGTPVLGAELLAEIRKRTRLPVRRVIVSHYHADHFYGLAAFKAAGAEIWAHRSARGYLASQAAKDRLAERSRSLAPWIQADMALEAPSHWLDREESFKLGGLTFRILPVGPAHTPEDLALLVEEEQVLFAGDLMFAGRLPFVGDADSKGWIEAIGKVLKLGPKVMIGGHGDASRNAAADLAMTRDYLLYLRQKMGDAANELIDFTEAYAKTDWSRFSSLPAFEAANRRNAYNTYIRMQGGDK